MTKVGMFALALALSGCGGTEPSAAKPARDDAKAKTAANDDPPIDETREATFADPKVEPPPAPEGSIALPDPWLYVQTCAAAHPCKQLLQPAGDAACRELRLGGYEDWRLPSKDEVPRFAGAAGLEQTAGYHWTRTPFEDDMAQVWIVDPSGEGPATTIPRDRKPFRIRCVKEP
ncbi:hypothetical protein ACNOYE_17975 [Nannocystaceae bacterium ST9]